MRVAHLVPALFGAGGVVGGAERYVFELARHMADEVPTTLVAFGERPSVEQIGRLTVRVFGPPHLVRGQRANPFAWSAIRAALRADVVHCHQQHIVASTTAAVAGRLRGRRVFCSDLGGGGWDLSAYVSTDRLYHGHLHISAYSRHVFGHDGLASAHVIYGGVDSSRFSPDVSAPRVIDCLFVGRLLPHKGVDVLLDAVTPEMTTVVMGPAPDARYLRDLQTAAAGKNVRFEHDAGDAEIVDAYRRAACVVLPSVYRDRYGSITNVPELLGQTLLEGMACGAAGVCTNVASLPEVVEDGVTGRVVPPNDPVGLRKALMWIKDHPGEAARMGAAGRARVLRRFTWKATVDRCIEIYAA
jgi:glycosyltransferase involved in cell wall biosynthesis